MKKKFNKDKIKSIGFYIGIFLYCTFLLFCIYDGFTYNKYGMGDYHNIKAFCFAFLLCYVFLFGGTCYIRYLENELDKADVVAEFYIEEYKRIKSKDKSQEEKEKDK